MNFLDFDTVSMDETTDELVILDQTRLPGEVVLLHLSSVEEIREAIVSLRVRGAPAIGVAAAIGLFAAASRIDSADARHFLSQVHTIKEELAGARPTAVNLTWALERMELALLHADTQDVAQLRQILKTEALAIRGEDVTVCRAIGESGLTLIKDGDGILTHCNAGQLAAVRYGTALAPIHLGREKGMQFHVYCDETRPLLQGARLSAYELCAAGVDTTVLCDNMVSSLMRQGNIQAVFVGCDRVAANGDTANKIGTSGVAILAKHYGIPFYVAAPTSTIDMACPDGEHIRIEQRDGNEVTELWYRERMAPQGVDVYNPAFDVTPHALVTAFVTERGIVTPIYQENFLHLMDESKFAPVVAETAEKKRSL